MVTIISSVSVSAGRYIPRAGDLKIFFSFSAKKENLFCLMSLYQMIRSLVFVSVNVSSFFCRKALDSMFFYQIERSKYGINSNYISILI